jgi:hypothetical protein
MRMRKLGKGHSLIFVAPLDVHRNIIDTVGSINDTVTSADVLKWTLEQTRSQLRKKAAQWVLQGVEHAQREKTIKNYITEGILCDQMEGNDGQIREFFKNIEEPESRPLSQLYGLHTPDDSIIGSKLKKIGNHPYTQILRDRWREIDSAQLGELTMAEEQEREVSIEVQQQETIEQPPPVKPRKPAVLAEIRYFVKNGKVDPTKFRASKDFSRLNVYPVSVMLDRTSAVSNEGVKVWDPKNLYVTREFVESVEIPKTARIDPYLRPIHWILSSTAGSDILILSPFEVNELWENISVSSVVRLHLYAPRFSQTAKDISKLDYYVLGGAENRKKSWPSVEVVRNINLLAGSLYLSSIEEYHNLLKYLGVLSRMESNLHGPGWTVGSDGFADTAARSVLKWNAHCPFKQSPIPFLKTLNSIWLKGEDFSSSHIGYITSSKPLEARHFTSRITKEGNDDNGQSQFVCSSRDEFRKRRRKDVENEDCEGESLFVCDSGGDILMEVDDDEGNGDSMDTD